ncbi:ankyrin repeat and SOCS box protein 9-like isoform X3 [Nerophis ophidion]|uniref:ankyrin repeat and SOCS box protein 9-like isoform X3 n=1 Tax=Nerophis ophidion TaxID=159077 RepID=UPI002AE08860|nr:ankyrin repeat and SOCS box protein 9-like isoform X3 [Nerophis ophidion]XP_061735109.1 ankyrin repeat and SOCS box protein 9-like isoform X3 [Nerophis ophidion]
MSGGREETRRGRQSGAAVFFSNPLMSDVEADWSPIHDAAFNGRVLNLQRLIAQGACVNLSTLDRVSALHGACMQGHAACAKLLLQNGADVNNVTLNGQTALSEACTRGHVTCVSLLLQHGASTLGSNPASSPLHMAAAKGASANSHDLGDSPLHIAARLSSPEMVSVLLNHGADASQRNLEGKQPLDLAPPNSVVERLLRQSGGVPPLMQLCRLHIRRTLGKQRLVRIYDLHLPIELKDYLLHLSRHSWPTEGVLT